MKKNTVIVIVVIALIVLAVILLGRKAPAPVPAGPTGGAAPQAELPPPAPDAPTPPEELARAVKIDLKAQNKSGESGSATIVEVGGMAKVSIDLKGIPANTTQPAHIHSGSCANLGDVKYPLGSIGLANESIMSISKSQLLSELPLAINIHKSAAEPGTYVACGDIPAE